MSESIKKIARLIAAAQLEDVRLVELTAKTTIRSPKDVGSVDFKISPSARVKERRKDGTFFVQAMMDARLIPTERRNDPAISVKAEYELKYRLPQTFKAPRRDLHIFAAVNGVFNAWPYWRELIQSIATRMNLPPLTLPLYRLGDAIKAPAKEVSEAKAG